MFTSLSARVRLWIPGAGDGGESNCSRQKGAGIRAGRAGCDSLNVPEATHQKRRGDQTAVAGVNLPVAAVPPNPARGRTAFALLIDPR